MTTDNRDFKGVWVPKEVWLDTRLNALEKIIFTEIDSLDSTERGCWASNKYIADFCQCSERSVSAAVSKLVKLGYLFIQSFDGRQRELKSKYTASQELQDGVEEFAGQPRKFCEADTQELRESNTSTNTLNNTPIKKVRKNNSFDEIITAYSTDEKTVELLQEWLKVRKAKRAAMTDRAIQMNIGRLDNLAKQSGMTVCEYLTEVICRGWAAFYPIQQYGKGAGKTFGANGVAIDPNAGDDLDGIL